MNNNSNKKILRWKVVDLHPHPRQGCFFSEPTPQEVEELAADMETNGLLQPVEALPDGTIIAGHKRVAAARLLGWVEIAVWVRDDLARDPAAAERRLIEDNLNRRQLGPLEMARCYKRLKLLEVETKRARLLSHEQQEFRDRIGKRLGVSGRTLDRYLRVLDHTPQEVQDAVATGNLAGTIAEKVAGLPRTEREQIAEEIRKGGNPAKVVKRFLGATARRVRNATDAKETLVRALRQGVADLDGRVDQVRWITADDEKALREGRELVEQLQQEGEKRREAEGAEDRPGPGTEESSDTVTDTKVELDLQSNSPAILSGGEQDKLHSIKARSVAVRNNSAMSVADPGGTDVSRTTRGAGPRSCVESEDCTARSGKFTRRKGP